MADIVLSVVAKVAEYLVQPVIRQGQYLFCIDKILKNLEDKKKELISTQGSVQKEVEEAKRKTKRIEDVVEKWLNDVQSLLEEVEKLEQEVKANNSCFQGQCPTWRRYHLCKQMVEKTKEMIEVNNKSNFKTFARLATLPGIEYSSTEDFKFFESTKLAYDQLLAALQDDGIYRIGLYGMGGSGKTTLATEVGKKAKESNLFDRVVEVTVSQTPDIRNIQGQMADMLKIKLEEETVVGRAQRLHMRLKGEKKILIIVDDVWGEFNLKDIGIDFGISHNGSCKVILTTRRQQVCNLMDCQRKILLELLNEDEAWALFQKHAHMDDQSSLSSLNSVAQNVARECKGLPIAIKAVGSSLKGQSIYEWEVALENLRSSKPVDVEAGQRDAFSCLRLSYDYLKDENKLLFLMCCIFPEDHVISIEDLIRCGVGLGVYGEYQSFNSARNQVTVGINKLVDSCLLMHSKILSRGKAVKMHDTIRDSGLWIASKEGRTIMVNLSNDLNSLIGNGVIKDHFAVSSWYSQINLISHQFVATKLEILWIETKSSLDLSSVSFEGMQGLKVMVLICTKVPFPSPCSLLLPPSIESLTNLRTLCFRGWKLGDISFVVRLMRLEVLDLKNCIFKKLPDEIRNLNKLKLLDLLSCAILENYESTGELSQIEELYVSGYSRRQMHHNRSFVDNITAPNLQRYVLEIAAEPSFHFSAFNRDLFKRVLLLGSFNITSVSASMKNILQRAEYVHFRRLHGGCQNIIPNMVGAVGGMNDLAMLQLDSCLETECVLDTTSDQVDVELPVLVKIHLIDMKNLKEVCRGPPLLCFFEKLEELHIRECPQLYNIFPRECKLPNLKFLTIGNEYRINVDTDINCRAAALFSMSVARSLAQLEKLTIEGYMELKHIITQEEDGDGTNTGEEIVPASDNSHLIFPNLKKLYVSNCPELEFILPITCVEGLEQLQKIVINDAPQLKYVFGQYDQRDYSSHQNNIQIMFPILKVLRLERLQNLCSICPEKYHPRCPSLRELHLSRCSKLTTLRIIVGTEKEQVHLDKGVAFEESQQKHLISKLEKLYLKFLPELKSIWTVPTPRQIVSLQYLQELKVEKCDKLKCLFSMVVHRNLPELTSLTIDQCEELEEIMEENEELKNPSNAPVCFPKLKVIEISWCKKLKSLFPVALATMLPQLSTLRISYADQLREVFRQSSEEGTSNGQEIVVPNLKELKFTKLPSFVGICPGLKLHAVNLLQILIDECPKFTPIFEATQVIPHHRIIEGVAFEESQQKHLISKLEKLYLEFLPELKSIWTVPTPRQILSLQYLQELKVKKCAKLKCLFSMVVHRHLPELTSLTIDRCEELEKIMEENEELKNLSNASVCFPKLKKIEISWCRKLKSLFPVALARMLPQLSTLRISHADQLRVVFRQSNEEGTSNEQEIVVPNLKKLELKKLRSLVGICSGLKLHAVNLQEMLINKCPKFAQIFEATQVIPHHLITEGSQVSATNNGQVTSQEQKMILGSSTVKWMYLKNLQYLECILEEPTPMSFQNLYCLRVSGCRKLKFIFFAGVIRSLCLPQLKYLYVENCEELKEIISEYPDQAEEWASRHQVCFPKLAYLMIWRCSKLKSVFSISMVKHLPQLRDIDIRKCSQLEQVFCCPSEANDGVVMEMEVLLPKLESLILRGLPSLTDIFGGSNQWQLPALQHLMVMHCSNFSSITYAALESLRLQHQDYYWTELRIIEEEGNDLYSQFLCTNYDSENEKECGKKKISHTELSTSSPSLLPKPRTSTSDSNPPDTLRVANSISATYFEMKNKLLPDIQEVVDDDICPDGWFKAYFDAATTQEETWAAALLLNHKGKLIGARTKKLSTKFLLEAEALALELAVELACDVVPKSNICLEGDCARVISELKDYLNDEVDDETYYEVDDETDDEVDDEVDNKMDNKMVYEIWYLEPILMDVGEKLKSMSDWEGKRIRRHFNCVAYNAAKWAAFCNSEGDVLNSVPDIEVLSRMDFVSSFFTKEEEDDNDHDQDRFLNNIDNEDEFGLLLLKMKEVFTDDDGTNEDKKDDDYDDDSAHNFSLLDISDIGEEDGFP